MAVRFIPNPALPALLGASLEMRGEMQEVGEAVAERAESNAPVLTGELAASVETETVLEDGVWKARVRATAPYAAFVEFGTEDTPAQSFLRPALDEVVGK